MHDYYIYTNEIKLLNEISYTSTRINRHDNLVLILSEQIKPKNSQKEEEEETNEQYS